jgi:hypothetical protein
MSGRVSCCYPHCTHNSIRGPLSVRPYISKALQSVPGSAAKAVDR